MKTIYKTLKDLNQNIIDLYKALENAITDEEIEYYEMQILLVQEVLEDTINKGRE